MAWCFLAAGSPRRRWGRARRTAMASECSERIIVRGESAGLWRQQSIEFNFGDRRVDDLHECVLNRGRVAMPRVLIVKPTPT